MYPASDDDDLPSPRSISAIRETPLDAPAFQVRRQAGTRWVVCARFRLLADALRYVSRHGEDGPFEILEPSGKRAASVNVPPPSRKRRRSAITIPTMPRFDDGGERER